MNKNLTEVVLVLDRSGSMASVKTDIEGGLTEFINKQKSEPGECYVSLYQFDENFETVFSNRDIQSIEEVKLTPRGSTALFDAIGKSINLVGERLANTPEDKRPNKVLFVVLTDGFENASREFNQVKTKEMIEHQTNKYDWGFIFMGSNQDAVLSGQSYGFSGASSLTYANNSNAITGAFTALYSGVACLRSGLVNSVSFSEQDRKAAIANA